MRLRAGRPMPADRPRTPRTLLIPDHLWDAFATMAAEMGTDRDALVNQAMFTFARLNGFVVPADLRIVASSDPGSHPTPPRSFSSAMGAENLDVEAGLLGGHPGAATSMELPNLTEYGVVRVDGVPTSMSIRDPRDVAGSGRVL